MRSILTQPRLAARSAAFLITFLLIGAVGAADDAVPLIVIHNVPLTDAIRNLTRQSKLNHILDPHVPGSSFGPGRLAPKVSVDGRWTNMTVRAALNELLEQHGLIMVTNPATTVFRIGPANRVIKPVPASHVGTNTSPVVPLLEMDKVSLTEAIRQLARAADLNALFDPKVSAPAFDDRGKVSFRWERITARQALAALLDNYGLVMVEDPVNSIVRISWDND